MQIRRTGPHARECGRPIFLRAANARFLRGLIAGRLQFGQELVETLGLEWREQFSALGFGPDFGGGVQTPITFGAIVARGAPGLVMRRSAFGCRFIDSKGIAWRANSFRQIGLALDQREIQMALFADERRAQPE